MNACTVRSKPKPPDPRLTLTAASNESLIASARNLTSNAPMKHSISKHRLPSISLPTHPMPKKLLPFQYPDRFELRYVSANGAIRWSKQWVNVSTVCAGQYVGLEEIDDGIWNVYFGPLTLGRFIEKHMRIEDALGRLKRVNV